MVKNILFTTTDLTQWWWVWRKISRLSKFFFNKGLNNFFLGYYDIGKKYKFYWKYYNRKEKLIINHFVALYKLFSRAIALKKFTEKNNIQVIFSFWEKANLPNLISKLLFKNKAKCIVQKTVDINYFSKIDNIFNYLYKFADNIIVLSNKTKLDLINKYWIKKEKIKVFKNPIDLKEIEIAKQEPIEDKYKSLFNNWKITFINIWRLTNQKNQELLIKSFDLLHKKFPNTQLIIIWWDYEWWYNKLSNLINNLWNKDIHLLWFQSNPYKFLAKSDIFVLSSKYEWLPNAVLDAMSCWLPIISVDCPTWPKELLTDREFNTYNDFKEISDISIEKYWILVPNYNVSKLKDAMKLLLNNKELQNTLRKNVLEKIKEFDLENVWNEYLNLIQ